MTRAGDTASTSPAPATTGPPPPFALSGYPYNRPHPISWSDLHHICHGDPDDERKGGHLHGTGRRGKTEFPPDWDEEKASEALTAVATHPGETDERGNGNWYATGTHEGVTVTAVVRPDGSIEAGWPDSGPGVRRNPPRRR
jgi:Bacterial EndoU nuclease